MVGSTRLLAYRSVRCHAAGSRSSSTTGYVAARSVTTSSGVTFVVAMGPFEEPMGRGDVTPRGDDHVNDLAELIDRSVHIPPSPSDLHVGLVHEPAISYSVPA
jgi:hypothetical protein